MGYAVYEDSTARDRGVERWAGYGVPAVCDMPGCEVKIDRGMGYRCEDQEEGCGLQFCNEHLDHLTHGDNITPKPDTAEWVEWMLTDESWGQWRAENPERVATLAAALEGGSHE